MPAMVMPFRVAKARSLAALAPGARIEFDLRGQAAHRIRVVETRRTEDIEFPRSVEELKVGQPVPDFTPLIRPAAVPFSVAGTVVLVNFLLYAMPAS